MYSALMLKCSHPSLVAFIFPSPSNVLNAFISRTQLLDDRVALFDSFFKIVLKILRDGDDTPAVDLAEFLRVPSQALFLKQGDSHSLESTSIAEADESNDAAIVMRTDDITASNQAVNFFAAADVSDLLKVPSWLQWT